MVINFIYFYDNQVLGVFFLNKEPLLQSMKNNNNNTFNLEAPFKTPKVTLQSI